MYEFKRYSKTAGEVYCISGCQDDQTSADAYIQSEKTFNGALTYILLSLLKSSDLKTLKWKHLLKDICCNEKVQGYTQRTAITSGNPLNLESAVFPLLSLALPLTPVKVSIIPLKKYKNKNIIMKKIFFI